MSEQLSTSKQLKPFRAAPLSARTSKNRRRQTEARLAYFFLSPVLLLFLVFFAAPLVATIAISLFSWDLLTSAHFIALQNYSALLSDSTVRSALLNTVTFTFWSVVLHIGFGLLLALTVKAAMPAVLRYIVRTAFFFPQLISWAAVALIWKYILDPNFGYATYYLSLAGLHPPDWLVSPGWAMPSLIFVDFWRTLGFIFIVLLAGLVAIPPHLYEAAAIDGAGPLQRFWNITLPMLSPTLLFATIVNVIGAFQIFEPMYIMTQGGPGNATRSIVELIYETAFHQFQMGYASAMAIVVLVCIMIFTLIQLRISRRWVHYD